MAESYKIELGIGLDDKQLNSVQTTINNLVDKERKINLDIDFNIKNANRLVEAGKEIDKLQTQIKELNGIGSTNKGKSALSFNTKSLEQSLNKINETIKKLQNAFGKVDKNRGVQSLLTTVTKIGSELSNVSKQFGELNRNLSSLSGKDFSLNFDFGLGNSSKNPEQAIKQLNMLKKEVEEYERYFAKHYSIKGNEDPISRLLLNHNQRNQLYGLQLRDAMTKGSDVQKIAAHKEFLKLIKETAAMGNISLAPVEFRLAESGEFVKVRNEVDETEKKLKELFSGGIDATRLHQTLNEISQGLIGIQTILQDLSEGVKIEGLTASFDKLSNTLDRLMANAKSVQDVLGNGLGNISNTNINSANNIESASDAATATVVQNEKKKQEAYKATADAVGYHAGIISKLNKAETNGRFYGSNRGTGYFGTGHYFVDAATKHELDNNNYYNKLPYTSVDISKYDNLFKATTDEVADGLHRFLGNLTYFTQGNDDYDLSELFAEFKSVFGDTVMDIKEFGSRLDQLKTFMSNSSIDDRSDSVSTQFMKSLGYGGVDTRGTSFADTRYGTVIYDLKEESILQANITDELQKQGQMLEKINYEKGQAFDKGEDDRIQGILDEQNKRREIAEEFEKSFDTTNFDKADNDLLVAKNRLEEIDEIIGDCQHSLNNLDQEYKDFSKEMSMLGLDDDDLLLWEDEEEWKQGRAESYKDYINTLSQEKEELQSKIPILEEVYNRESQLVNEAYERAKQTVEQRHLESQQAQETANAVVQTEESKQEAIRETANAYNKISKDTSLVRDDSNFRQAFEDSNQAAQEAQRHFQELLADEKAVVTVSEQFDKSNALQSFAVNVKRASGEVETLRYALVNLADQGEEERWGFVYQGASANDSKVERQLESHIKKANDLQIKLDKIKSGYSDMGSAKPIKDSSHIEALDKQYRKVERAIADVRNADNSTFSSMISNAEKEKSALENMVREFRNAENIATSLRSKDIDTVKSTYASKLDVLISKMQSSGVYTSGFENGAENLRSILSSATDASGLVKFLNGLDKLESGYKRADVAVKEFNRSQKVGINVSGLESKIADIQRISPEIDQFKTEINGAEVSVKSLLSDLSKVKTQGDFSVVNSKFKAFADAAKAAGIAVTEATTKMKSVDDIRLKMEHGTFDNDISQMYDKFNKLSSASTGLRDSVAQVENAYREMENALKGTGDEVADRERLIQAEKSYADALEKTNNLLRIQAREEKARNEADKLDYDITAFQLEIDTWLKNNSAAAKRFGGTMSDLRARANDVDRVTLNGLIRQFRLADKEAEKLGLKGLNNIDKLKAKFSEYATYLSAAEVFSWISQGLRDMFEQVKLIDSAMTELKKVTDETDESYNKFLSNAADRSKEIGTTIDGLVKSTADFARLGYGFQDAQGLAEVANIYAVVGDEINGVEGATESLISTMAAFKDEMNGMSNTDFAMSIIDKFNEIGNNFAISSGGIGEALERSASSLMAANNTIDESIALITAANSVVQDPTQVGRLMPTLKVAISVKLLRRTRPRKGFVL